MKKELIFFDGDGTLWYPKTTRYAEKPWWVYLHPEKYKHAEKHLTLTPNAKSVLKRLKSLGISLVVLSSQPYAPQEARDASVMRFVEHFGIAHLFDEIYGSRIIKNRGEEIHTKDRIILKVLRRRGVPKSKALMVGDMYHLDYAAAKKVGVDAVLVGYFHHNKENTIYKRVRRRIKDLSGIFKYLN